MKHVWEKGFFALLLLASLTAFGCSDGGSRVVTPPAVVSGSVVQGPVSGALVIADKNGNFQLDANEASTYTDENGDFNDLVIPENYGPYVLVSLGGVDTITDEPALPMLAPAGAENITPVTTLVALAPEAEQAAMIAELDALAGDAGSYDADPSVDATAEFVSLVKAVEETLYLMQDLGVAETADQFTVVEEISSQLIEDDTIADIVAGTETTVSSSIQQGVVDALPELEASTTTEFAVDAGSESDFGAIVEAVIVEVETVVVAAADANGNVTETETLLDPVPDVDTIIADDPALTPIEEIAQSVALNLESVAFLDEFGVETNSAGSATQINVVLSAFNNTGVVADYSDVALTLSVIDQASQRSIAFELSGVALTATSANEISAIGVDLTSATLDVTATKADGTTISTNAVTGAFEVFNNNYSNNELTVNLLQVQNLFADQVAPEFATVSAVGDYAITLQATGAPIASAAETVAIEQ